MPGILKRHHYKTRLCELDIAAQDGFVIAVSFSSLNDDYILSLFNNTYTNIGSGNGMDYKAWLDLYFSGKDPGPVPPLRLYGTAFRINVLKACMKIPYGECRSYAELTAMAGSPNAARATGSALAMNPLPLFIPCHRVIRSDGKTGEFGGGTALKNKLINLEKGKA